MTYKGKQRTDSEDRSEDYRNWRHTFGKKRYVIDLDQVEYKIVNDKVIPVGVLELTRVDEPVRCADALQSSVLHRIDKQYAQGKALRTIAERIGVHAYIVLFVKDLSEFHIYNLSTDTGWYICESPEKYVHFIDWLHDRPNQ